MFDKHLAKIQIKWKHGGKKWHIFWLHPHFFHFYQYKRRMATYSTSITILSLMTSRQLQIVPLVYHLTQNLVTALVSEVEVLSVAQTTESSEQLLGFTSMSFLTHTHFLDTDINFFAAVSNHNLSSVPLGPYSTSRMSSKLLQFTYFSLSLLLICHLGNLSFRLLTESRSICFKLC